MSDPVNDPFATVDPDDVEEGTEEDREPTVEERLDLIEARLDQAQGT